MKNLALGFVVASILAACGTTQKLPPQTSSVDTIAIMNGSDNSLLKEIKEPGQIERVVGYINALDNDWGKPFFADPTKLLELKLIQDGKFVGNFLVGEDYFGRAHRLNWVQSADEMVIKQFGYILGIDVEKAQIITPCTMETKQILSALVNNGELVNYSLEERAEDLLAEAKAKWCQMKLNDQYYRLHYTDELLGGEIIERLGEGSTYFGPQNSF